MKLKKKFNLSKMLLTLYRLICIQVSTKRYNVSNTDYLKRNGCILISKYMSHLMNKRMKSDVRFLFRYIFLNFFIPVNDDDEDLFKIYMYFAT